MTFSHATLLYHISRQVATPIAVPYLVYAKSGSGCVRVGETPDRFIAASLIAIHTWHRPLKLITTLAVVFPFNFLHSLLSSFPSDTPIKTHFCESRKYHIFPPPISSFYSRPYIFPLIHPYQNFSSYENLVSNNIPETIIPVVHLTKNNNYSIL